EDARTQLLERLVEVLQLGFLVLTLIYTQIKIESCAEFTIPDSGLAFFESARVGYFFTESEH
ncbi:hypothetical protein, partial [Anaerotruncus colihominis]|uniref:hypothetical protein n=1 Tax=Anaerotruncus colihominis TaxID=169435 RepID=UPI003AB48614